MKTIDDATLRQWLDLELDVGLGAAEKEDLERHLAASTELRAEREKLRALHALLASDRVAVREGFAARVAEALPVAPWQRRAGAWRLPAALLAFFAVGAALLLAGARSAGGPIAGTVVALTDFLSTSFLAGAGLLSASWRGAGMGLEQLFADSQVSLLGFGLLVLFLNLLFFSMLRRRRPAEARSDADER